MPYTYEQYRAPAPYQPAAPQPYVQYRSPYTGSLAQLMGSADRANAAAALASGEAQARIAQSIGAGVNDTLNTIIKARASEDARKEEAQQREVRQQQIDKEKARIADEATLTSVMTGAGRTPRTNVEFTLDENGQPVGEAVYGAVAPGGERPSREEMLSQLPGHLQGTAMKLFQESDELGRKATESRRKALDDVIEHTASLGYSVVKADGNPAIAQAMIEEARKTYADDPEILKGIEAFESQLGDMSDPAHNKQVGTLLANRSPRYMAELSKPEPTTVKKTVGPDGTVWNEVIPTKAGERWQEPPPQAKPGDEAFYLTAYARGLGKDVKDLTSGEINAANKLAAVSKHIESSSNATLTAEQRADLVDAVVKNPVIYGQLPAKTKEAIVPALNALGFDQFDVGLSASGKAAAEKWRYNALAKLDAVGYTPAERAAEVQRIDAVYRTIMGGAAEPPSTPGAIPQSLRALPPDPNDLGIPPPPPSPRIPVPPGPPPIVAPTAPRPGEGGTLATVMAPPPAPPPVAAPPAPPAPTPPPVAAPSRPVVPAWGQRPAAAPAAPARLPEPAPGGFQVKVGDRLFQFPTKAAAQAWAQKHGMSLR